MSDSQPPDQADSSAAPLVDPALAGVHSVGVGGWVTRADGAVLLVRMTYGPAKGRLMLPGGHLERCESLECGALRELREETGVLAAPQGLLAVRQHSAGEPPNLYFVLWMIDSGQQPAQADGIEVSEVLWLQPSELAERDDVQTIVLALAAAWLEQPGRALAPRTWLGQAREYHLWAAASE